MPINGCYISDEEGEPRIFSMKGGDPSDPDKVERVYLEVRPGGMVVAKNAPNTARVTVAADPVVPPSLAQVEDERRERQIQSLDREREAIRQEREARGEIVAEQPSPSAGTEHPSDLDRDAAVSDATDDTSGEDAEAAREREEAEARESAKTKTSAKPKTGGRSRARAAS